MSKKHRSRRDNLTTLLNPPIATPRVHRPPVVIRVSYKTNNFALGLIEDRRTHYPGLSPFKRPVQQMAVGRPARLTLVEPKRYGPSAQTKATVAFAEPQKLPLCHRRKTRKEVLHATGKAGGKVRPPKRNEWSDVSCSAKS